MTADVQRELAEAMRRKIHQAIYDEMVDHPMWIDDRGRGLDYSPERENRIGDFLRAAADALLPLIADAEKRAAAAALTDLADDFDNGPFYAQATRYFADRDVDADGMDVARIIRVAALDPT